MPRRYPTPEEKRQKLLESMRLTAARYDEDVKFIPVANVMAAGPCADCLEIAKHSYRVDEAPLMPLETCPHPDQCTSHYRLDLKSIWPEFDEDSDVGELEGISISVRLASDDPRWKPVTRQRASVSIVAKIMRWIRN